ncbi:DUF2381 family protein [Stigmatella sp. ncwal1]|uniref:DUF2381 family protein n=1 Tax=Stigmatella ashevillensis TaxID=2995309 RepID=A0ABT5DG69_9BACT|nr:DUF2381 family protein [Stigmatella ashevillena]MDC0712662.1 DUF2381 family protein [Stigmatella ashevillena]
MIASPSTALVTWVLLTTPAVEQPALGTCSMGIQHLEVPPVPREKLALVCISPGQTTVINFDADLAMDSMTLDGAERFTKVEFGASTVKLIPSEKLRPGDHLRLTVRFKDTAAPSSVTLLLGVHVAQAVPFVSVLRETRTVESYQQELKTKNEELQKCIEENTRLQVESTGPGGLAELFMLGLLSDDGISSKLLHKNFVEAPTNALSATGLVSYRAANRAALMLMLANKAGMAPWTAESATLTREGKNGMGLRVLTVWQPRPIENSAEDSILVVEVKAPDDLQGSYTLKLWEAGGARTVTLHGVTFPAP